MRHKMEPQEQDQAAKLQQIIQLATELLQGEQKESLLLKIKNKRAEKTLSIRQSENKIKKDLLKEHNLKMETITTNLEAKINKRQKRIENLVTENYELQKRIYNLTEENSKYLEQIIK